MLRFLEWDTLPPMKPTATVDTPWCQKVLDLHIQSSPNSLPSICLVTFSCGKKSRICLRWLKVKDILPNGRRWWWFTIPWYKIKNHQTNKSKESRPSPSISLVTFCCAKKKSSFEAKWHKGSNPEVSQSQPQMIFRNGSRVWITKKCKKKSQEFFDYQEGNCVG